VLAALLELAAHAEARLALDNVREAAALAGERVRRLARPRREGRAIDRTGQRCAQFVGEERRRIGDDVENLGLQLRTIVPLGDEALDELMRELDRLAGRHAEADEVFGLHVLIMVKMGVAACGHTTSGQRCLFYLSY